MFGPPEETESCAERTVEALQIFQEQGYQLEWTGWDGEEVPEEWRHLYSAPPQKQSSQSRSSQRHLEKQGY
ncbi:MAG: hypothetical protein HC862_24260 [Scytonema sp. RU_4_4]|nr:hypothetical protein [Scytonema sp. RU_4_4]